MERETCKNIKNGERCTNTFLIGSNSIKLKRKGVGVGYCWRCAIKKGYVKPEHIKRQVQRQSKSQTMPKKKDPVLEKEGQKLDIIRRVNEILGIDRFDLKDAIKTYEELGSSIAEDSVKHILFIQWSISDDNTRYPQTINEFAKIIGISATAVRNWLKSEWFGDDIAQERVNLYQLMSYLADKQLLVGVMEGDNQAIREFYRQKEVLDERMGKNKGRSLVAKLGDDIIDEANRIAGDGNKRFKKDEKELIDALAPKVIKSRIYGDH